MSYKIKNKDMDMTTGSLWNKILIFAVPVILSGLIQQLFHSVDMSVIGKFCGSKELAAVGSNGPITNLLIGTFLGFSAGANVVIAQCIGKKDVESAKNAMYTSLFIALVTGILITVAGIILARPMLRLLSTPDEIIELSTVYLRMYFLATPFLMLYNFAAAILRSRGKSGKPLYCLIAGGLVNVVLNLLFVVVFKWGVAGVGVATALSNMVSCALIFYIMDKDKSEYHITIKNIKFDGIMFLRIFKVGLPIAIQSSLFPVSNMVIQSSVNSLGTACVAGYATASVIEGYSCTTISGIDQANITFTSQNYGANKIDRCKKVMWLCMMFNMIFTTVISVVVTIFLNPVLSVFTTDPEVMKYAAQTLIFTYFSFPFLVLMDIFSESLRGIGYSVIPTIASIGGICGFRILWMLIMFKKFPVLNTILAVYPLSWGLVAFVLMIIYINVMRKMK